MALKGTVRYSGYKTGGVVKLKGMKNMRKKKLRLKKEAANRAAQARQRKLEEHEADYSASADWD